MTDTRPKVVRLWPNTIITERRANYDLAVASASMSQFVPAFVIDAYFQSDSPTWWEARRDTWQEVWQVEKQEVVIGESTIEAYIANRVWMAELYGAILGGEVTLEEPYGLIINFYGQPVTYEP